MCPLCNLLDETISSLLLSCHVWDKKVILITFESDIVLYMTVLICFKRKGLNWNFISILFAVRTDGFALVDHMQCAF